MKVDLKNVPKIGFISLGCPKNLVDSERILTKLKSDGYDLSGTYENANVVIVNTCGFIDDAVKESLNVIGEAMALNGKVLVTGCLGGKSDVILNEYPNVLGISGAHEYESVVKAVHKVAPIKYNSFTNLVPEQGIKLTPRHFAYLKISEGCNNSCRFCIIPSFRGKLKSRDIDNVLKEAQRLVKVGVKELLVISQDTSAYGVDIRYKTKIWNNEEYKTNFFDLALALSKLNIWVRFHYVYPYPHVDKVIPLMAEGKILPYLDIPLQHSSPKILKSMKRPANKENTLKRIKKWREICPNLCIRSTFIVGFPDETEEDFNDLLGFLQEAKINRVGCFKYSDVDGAAANHLENKISEEVKEKRYNKFMEVQSLISKELLSKKVGDIEEVIIDEIHKKEDLIIARTKYDAPEVDGIVAIENIKDFSKINIGDKILVKIIDCDDYDLVGEII